jgi:hypothetical protein
MAQNFIQGSPKMFEEKGGEVAEKWQNHAVGRVTVEQIGLPLDHEGQ